jgi:hypothetical protein
MSEVAQRTGRVDSTMHTLLCVRMCNAQVQNILGDIAFGLRKYFAVQLIDCCGNAQVQNILGDIAFGFLKYFAVQLIDCCGHAVPQVRIASY